MADKQSRYNRWQGLLKPGFRIDRQRNILYIPPDATKELVRARITTRYFLFSE